MRTYILRRVVATLPVLLGVSLVVFSFLKLVPGDPSHALLGPEATPEQYAALRQALGLDEPIHVQYLSWLNRAVRGDLGRSIETREPVLPIIWKSYQNSLLLAAAAFVYSTLVGMLIGIVSATRPRSAFDRCTMLVALFGVSMPAFWLGIMLILLFSVQLGWFPVGGMSSVRGDGGAFDLLRHLTLPAVTLGTLSLAVVARMTRSTMLEVVHQEYVRTARAKGLREWAVIGRHALKNALLPVLTVVALQLGLNLGGAVLTETVFSWPGLGRQIFRSISTRDLPVLQGGTLILALSFVMINLAVDLLYAVIDPRIRYRGGRE